MFVGHLGIGFAAKRFVPKPSLGTVVLAAMLADVLGFAFIAPGIEHIGIKPGMTRVNALELYDFTWSHSLVMDLICGALFAGAYIVLRRYWHGAWIIFIAVPSHWLLDWASHRPDMPLVPGVSRYYGLGLYNSPLALLVVEGALCAGGILLYQRTTQPRTTSKNIRGRTEGNTSLTRRQRRYFSSIQRRNRF